MVVAALVVACSSSDDDDEGCKLGEKACSTDADCVGFKPVDFALLGPPIDARCFRTECVAEKCQATPIPGRVEDDADGDCARSSCNEEGRLERTPDPSDPPSSEVLGPCQRSVCEEGFFGGLGSTTRPAPEGSSCFSGGESGTCVAGQCVLDSVIDDAGATDDAASDAAGDAEPDGAADASMDSPDDG
jgi:hypothetical protein